MSTAERSPDRKVIGGTGKNDRLDGTAGNDTLDGKAGDDKIDGKAGDDILVGGPGRNVLKGGVGIDTAVFAGKMGGYDARYANGGLVIFKRGTETTIDASVERLKFGAEIVETSVQHRPVVTSILTSNGSVSDGGSTFDAMVIVKGTADPFARITVRIDNVEVGTATANAKGRWSFDHLDAALAEGSTTIRAVADYGKSTKASVSAGFHFDVGHLVDLAKLTTSDGLMIWGDELGFRLSVSSAGDINGDGFDDLILGNGYGAAYVVYGTASNDRRKMDLGTLSAADGFIIQGNDEGESVGRSVSSAGDINGDGFDDLIVGAPRSYGGPGAGKAYVIFGTASGFGSDVSGRQVIDLATLSASQGFIIQGYTGSEFAGSSVSCAGDVNGDDFDDLIIGAPNGREAYVVFGTDQGFGVAASGRQVVNLEHLSMAEGFIIKSNDIGDEAGRSVSSAGDVNGDGFDDLIIGAPGGLGNDVNSGVAYVVFGTDAGFGIDVSGRQIVDLSTLDASQGFIILGDSMWDNAGRVVSSAGDLNGDGFDDLVVGAPKGDDGGDFAGEAYVIFGTDQGFGVSGDTGQKVVDLTFLSGAEGFIIRGRSYENVGSAVSSAGDINGDGLDDLIIGVEDGGRAGSGAGEAYVVFGSDQGFGRDVAGRFIIDLRKFDVTQGIIIQGANSGDEVGRSVSSAGDVNGDGFDDLVIAGEPQLGDHGSVGAAYVIYGGAFGADTTPIVISGTSSAEMFIGGAGDDLLDGNGGADRFRSGNGNDAIKINDATFKIINAGLGRADTLIFDGIGFSLDAREFSNRALSGIEAFDMTTGNNALTLAANDIFHLSTVGNSAFTGAGSHNNVVVLGDSGDSLTLVEYTSAGATWRLARGDKALDGSASGAFDLFDLVDGDGNVLASVAVNGDVEVFL